jgi:hypothetical protein
MNLWLSPDTANSFNKNVHLNINENTVQISDSTHQLDAILRCGKHELLDHVLGSQTFLDILLLNHKNTLFLPIQYITYPRI